MRVVYAALIVVVVAGFAWADENPNGRVFVTADPDSHVSQIDVPAGVPFNIYLVVDCIDTGLRGVAVTMLHDIPGFPAGVPVYLNDGTQTVGGFNDPAGWAIAWADCEYPDPATGMLPVVEIPYFASGPGSVTLSAHPTDGKITLDCGYLEDPYCILQNLGVGEAPPAGDAECTCDNPVEASTWGGIKALYQ
ncbi:MAG: hypothetical protein GF405_01210 [Candidatus Eisenbacteria bacterium]|nr:hypothetical protein [Candidatus Eisenbacteria bacterium]